MYNKITKKSNFSNNFWSKVKTNNYIFATVFKHNWGYLILFLWAPIIIFLTQGTFFYKGIPTGNLNAIVGGYNVILFELFLLIPIASCGGIFLLYSSMKVTVMFKRIGLSGINSKAFFFSYIYLNLLITIPIILFFTILNFIGTFIGLGNNSIISSSNYYKIIFNSNIFINGFYTLIYIILIISLFYYFNSVIWKASRAQAFYQIANILNLIIVIVVIPIILKNQEYKFFNSWDVIKDWSIGFQILLFLGLLSIIAFAALLFKLGYKKFSWAN